MSRPWTARALGLLSLASTGCFHGHIQGSFTADSGPGQPWQLAPDRCLSGGHSGYIGADMYRAQPGDDTELVVVTDGAGLRVLARVPNTGQMVVLTPGDCARFEAHVGYNGVTVNDIPAVAGSVRIDCTRPEIGHVQGQATFTCY